MRITEIFHSLQGEGPDTGRPTTFVRTAGCNLRCTWCDTTYSFGEGTEMSLTDLLSKVKAYPTKHVCFTGGEPLLQGDAIEFVKRLSTEGYRVVIETGGSLDVHPYATMPGVVISLDVKCPSSAMEGRTRMENLSLLRSHDVVKFVVKDRVDYDFAKSVLSQHRPKGEIIFQPVWGSDAARLAAWVLEDGLDVRVMLQQHKHIWGDVPGR